MYNYTNTQTEVTYMLNTSKANYYEAEEVCMERGGHLVSYTSIEEQLDVEAYFEASSGLLATYSGHK